MTARSYQQDLVVLVADKNMEAAASGIFTRSAALRIRDVTKKIYVHPERDPGCLLSSRDFLRPFSGQFEHALVLFDREGCGQEMKSREDLELDVEKELSVNGWADRATVIVIDPELESWVWNDSTHVDDVLGWRGKNPTLREWLGNKGFLNAGEIKPSRPKEAMEGALRFVRKPHSSAIYLQIAQRVSIERCTDGSFIKLKQVLQQWFPSP